MTSKTLILDEKNLPKTVDLKWEKFDPDVHPNGAYWVLFIPNDEDSDNKILNMCAVYITIGYDTVDCQTLDEFFFDKGLSYMLEEDYPLYVAKIEMPVVANLNQIFDSIECA